MQRDTAMSITLAAEQDSKTQVPKQLSHINYREMLIE
jgi:hypothetical protein